MAANGDLARIARRLADEAAPGSLERRAAGCVSVACLTTRTIAGAKRALQTVRPGEVRRAAEALLEDITQQEVPAP